MEEQKLNNGSQPALQQTDVSRLLLLFDQMIKEENEALGKAGFYNQYGRETHANNKYCLAIVKSLIERRFGNSGYGRACCSCRYSVLRQLDMKPGFS